MGRSEQKALTNNSQTANQLEGQNNAAAQGELATVTPALQQEISNPQGFGVPGVTALNTSIGQATGGATAGAEGAGNLEAARTRNAGGFAPAIEESARAGGRTGADNALKVTMANEAAKQSQKQSGLGALQQLYGTNTGATLGSLGLSNQSLTNASQAYKSPWDTFLTSLTGSLGSTIGSGAGFTGG